MTDAERELLIHVARWLIQFGDPNGEGVAKAAPLVARVVAEHAAANPARPVKPPAD